MDFDELFSRHMDDWRQASIGVSALLKHSLDPTLANLLSVLGSELEVELTDGDSEGIGLKPESLFPVPKEQRTEQALRLFRKSLDCVIGRRQYPETDAILPELLEKYFNQFENPIVFANSTSANWGWWQNLCSRNKKHAPSLMFMACMDENYAGFIVGIEFD